MVIVMRDTQSTEIAPFKGNLILFYHCLTLHKTFVNSMQNMVMHSAELNIVHGLIYIYT